MDNISENNGYQDVLKRYFGLHCFKDLQWNVINAVMNEKKDVCLFAATGFGKSLCYQFPPIYENKLCIVFSPLIALMHDQVNTLKEMGIKAIICQSKGSKKFKDNLQTDILKMRPSLIYVTPEYYYNNAKFFTNLDKIFGVCLIAFDEAHCISQWGNEFRPLYLKVAAGIKAQFPHIPILALTATATQAIKNDIIDTLKLQKDPRIFICSLDRSNIYFSAQKMVDMETDFTALQNLKIVRIIMDPVEKNRRIYAFSGTTIIYVPSKVLAHQLFEFLLDKRIQNKIGLYHADLPMSRRHVTQAEFMKGTLTVIIATIAFGMGINKAGIRNIIHYSAPKSLEAYYQEMGRAGRRPTCPYSEKQLTSASRVDATLSQNFGAKRKNCDLSQNETEASLSYSHIFYSAKNFATYKNFAANGQLLRQPAINQQIKMVKAIETYCNLEVECRRQFLLSYFMAPNVNSEEQQRTNSDTFQPMLYCCDNCTKIKRMEKRLKSMSSITVTQNIPHEKNENNSLNAKSQNQTEQSEWQNKIQKSLNIPSKLMFDLSSQTLIPAKDYKKHGQVFNSNELNVGPQTHIFLSTVRELHGLYGLSSIILILRGSHNKRLRPWHQKSVYFGKGQSYTELWWKELAKALIEEEYIVEKYVKNPKIPKYYGSTLQISPKGVNWLSSVNLAPTLFIKRSFFSQSCLKEFSVAFKTISKAVNDVQTEKNMEENLNTEKSFINNENINNNNPNSNFDNNVPSHTTDKVKIYQKLLALRSSIAAQTDGLSPFMIASNAELLSLTKIRPNNIDEIVQQILKTSPQENTDGNLNKAKLLFSHKVLEYFESIS